jgi:hypothetical protein
MYLSGLMVSNGNPKFLWHALPKDKEVNCAVGFSCEIQPQSSHRWVKELISWQGPRENN